MDPSYYDDLRAYVLLSTVLSIMLVAGLMIVVAVSRLWSRGDSAVDPRFEGREPLTLDQFYQRFYAEEGFSRATVQEVLVSFAEASRLPHSYLRPQDSFLALHVPDSDRTQQFAVDAATLIHEGERRYGARLFEGQLSTLDDYIRIYALAQRLVSRRDSAGA